MDHDLIKKLAQRCGECFIEERGTEEEPKASSPVISARIPGLTEEKYREIRIYVQTALSNILKPEERTRSRDPIVRSKLKSIVMRGLLEKDIPLGEAVSPVLVEELGNDLLGYGPIEPFFYDPEVTEIKAGRDIVRIEKQGIERIAEGVRFRNEDHIRDVLERMLAPTGRKIDMASPKVNARLIDGSRMIAHIPPVAVNGVMFTIRRFRKDMTVDNLIKRNVMSPEVVGFLKAAVISKQNIVISGGTSSGKTTVLNCLASFIPEEESIVTIEDPAELQLQHTNVRSLEARPATADTRIEISQRDLVVDALRMAPKRIIVGECRAGETFDMLQAMNTGHKGSLTTAHANSSRHCTRRLVNMVQMAKMDIPYDGIVEQVADAVDIFIHVLKDRTGRRRMDHICEVVGTERIEGVLNVKLNTLWQYSTGKDAFEWVVEGFNRRDALIDEGGWVS
ncbi:MAG: CpaF family protein [Desulfocucumaceae bacterium]